jgi:hypothetical protein
MFLMLLLMACGPRGARAKAGLPMGGGLDMALPPPGDPGGGSRFGWATPHVPGRPC